MEENEEDEDEEEDKDWQEWNPKASSADSARGWGPSGWFRRQQSHFWSGKYWRQMGIQWEDKKRSLHEPDTSDRQTRPTIDFTHLKIQKALDVSKGKMGDSSEEEDEPKEEQEDEVKGLPRTPTGGTGTEEDTEGEAEEEKPEGEEAENPGGEEEEEEAQGDLNSFEAPPVSYKPSPNGPGGKDWTRVDFIVDSGASGSTIPKVILPNVPLGEVKGFREFSMADGRCSTWWSERFSRVLHGRWQDSTKLVFQQCHYGISMWQGAPRQFLSLWHDQTPAFNWEDGRTWTYSDYDTLWWLYPVERFQDEDRYLQEEWCVEDPSLDLDSGWGFEFSGAGSTAVSQDERSTAGGGSWRSSS